jgi:hypothetical protein
MTSHDHNGNTREAYNLLLRLERCNNIWSHCFHSHKLYQPEVETQHILNQSLPKLQRFTSLIFPHLQHKITSFKNIYVILMLDRISCLMIELVYFHS